MKPKHLLILLTVLIGGMAQAQTASKPAEDEPFFASNKEVKRNIVNLYMRKDKNVVNITSHRPFDVQIYIFGLDGVIQYQGILKSKEKTKVEGLTKGTYTYSIFYNDESIEEGKLTIR